MDETEREALIERLKTASAWAQDVVEGDTWAPGAQPTVTAIGDAIAAGLAAAREEG